MEVIILISIIISAYNVEKYIDKCIASVVNQTYKDIEIIVINDGSTDATKSICDKWAGRDSRINVVHKKNEGISAARNDGLKLAKGEYISFVDSDDYLDIRMMEIMLKSLKDYDADISICKEYAFNEDEEPAEVSDTVIGYKLEKIEANREILSHFTDRFTGPIGWPWNKLYSRKIIADTRFVKGHIMEDLIFNSSVMINVNKAVWIEDRLYYYRQRKGSLMNSNKSAMYTDYGNAIMEERKMLYPVLDISEKKRFASYFLRKLSELDMEAAGRGFKQEAGYIREIFNEIYFTDIKLVDSIKDKMKISLYRHFRPIYYFLRTNKIKYYGYKNREK